MSERAELLAALRRGTDVAPFAGGHPPEDVLARLLDGRLLENERPAVESHVARCDACAKIVALAGTDDVKAAVPTATAMAERDAATGGRDARAATGAPRRGRVLRRVVLAGALAAGLAYFLLGGIDIPLGGWTTTLAARLGDAVGRPVQIGSAAIHLGAKPGLALTDVALAEPGGSGAGSVLEVQHLLLRLEPAEMLQGRLALDLALERPLVKLVQEPSGRWNVEDLGRGHGRAGGEPTAARGPADVAGVVRRGDGRWRLAAGSVSEGRIDVVATRADGTETTLALEAVTARYGSESTTAGAPGPVSLRARLAGTAGSIELEGSAGPFDGTPAPRWDLPRVRLAALPIAALPGAPTTIDGALSFDGRLTTDARDPAGLATSSTGDGHLRVENGHLHGRNLANDLVGALGEADGQDPAAWRRALAAAVVTEPEVAAALAARETSFRSLEAGTRLGAGTLQLDGLRLATELFDASADGSVAWNGSLSLEGSVELAPRVAGVLVAATPRLENLRDGSGRIRLPFALAGRWPGIRLHIDLDRAVAHAVAPARERAERLARAWYPAGLQLLAHLVSGRSGPVAGPSVALSPGPAGPTSRPRPPSSRSALPALPGSDRRG